MFPVSSSMALLFLYIADFVFFHTFGDRSVGLPIIETDAVFAGCFVDGVGSEVRGRRGLRLGEDSIFEICSFIHTDSVRSGD